MQPTNQKRRPLLFWIQEREIERERERERERRWKGPFHQGEVFLLFYLGFYALNQRRKE
jgi:hypothetical protein